jgi:DNA gyrase subunit A
MSIIRAEQVAAEAQAETSEGGADVKPQYVFTMTDGGFAKRTAITEYRITNRGGLGIKAMSLTNEDRGGLVGGFIVVEGDEILAITQGGQVVRSPINSDFRATGRDTMGVKFVTPKSGDSIAVVTRSMEAPDVIEEVIAAGLEGDDNLNGESPDGVSDATIDSDATSYPDAEPDPGPDVDPGE